ncbi:G protein gamma domain-containing protein, variant 2 [Balamuthia mandrillaris]
MFRDKEASRHREDPVVLCSHELLRHQSDSEETTSEEEQDEEGEANASHKCGPRKKKQRKPRRNYTPVEKEMKKSRVLDETEIESGRVRVSSRLIKQRIHDKVRHDTAVSRGGRQQRDKRWYLRLTSKKARLGQSRKSVEQGKVSVYVNILKIVDGKAFSIVPIIQRAEQAEKEAKKKAQDDVGHNNEENKDKEKVEGEEEEEAEEEEEEEEQEEEEQEKEKEEQEKEKEEQERKEENEGDDEEEYFWELQYFFFYSFNGAVIPWLPTAGIHEGDWEHMSVRATPDGSSIAAVYMACHGSEGRWYLRPSTSPTAEDGYRLTNITHPIAYSARGGHATYAWPGRQKRRVPTKNLHLWVIDDDTCDKGIRWQTWRNVVLIHDVRQHIWLQYCGEWGDKATAPLSGMGPWGPAHKDFYLLGEEEAHLPLDSPRNVGLHNSASFSPSSATASLLSSWKQLTGGRQKIIKEENEEGEGDEEERQEEEETKDQNEEEQDGTKHDPDIEATFEIL